MRSWGRQHSHTVMRAPSHSPDTHFNRCSIAWSGCFVHWFKSSYLTYLLVVLATSFSYMSTESEKKNHILPLCQNYRGEDLPSWGSPGSHVSWPKLLYDIEFLNVYLYLGKCIPHFIVSLFPDLRSPRSIRITITWGDCCWLDPTLHDTCGGGNVTGVISDSGGVMHSVRHLPGIITLLQHRPCTISKPPTIILLRPGLSWNNRHCLGLESGYVSK